MLFAIFIILAAIVISTVIYIIFESWIGYVICGILLALLLLSRFFLFLLDDHPIIFALFNFIASVICALASIMAESVWPITICVLAVAFIKGSFNLADADTEWYDTDTISIDGVLYNVFSPDRSNFITALGLLAFMAVYALFLLPYLISNNDFFVFVPCVFFLVQFIRSLKELFD